MPDLQDSHQAHCHLGQERALLREVPEVIYSPAIAGKLAAAID